MQKNVSIATALALALLCLLTCRNPSLRADDATSVSPRGPEKEVRGQVGIEPVRLKTPLSLSKAATPVQSADTVADAPLPPVAEPLVISSGIPQEAEQPIIPADATDTKDAITETDSVFAKPAIVPSSAANASPFESPEAEELVEAESRQVPQPVAEPIVVDNVGESPFEPLEESEIDVDVAHDAVNSAPAQVNEFSEQLRSENIPATEIATPAVFDFDNLDASGFTSSNDAVVPEFADPGSEAFPEFEELPEPDRHRQTQAVDSANAAEGLVESFEESVDLSESPAPATERIDESIPESIREVLGAEASNEQNEGSLAENADVSAATVPFEETERVQPSETFSDRVNSEVEDSVADQSAAERDPEIEKESPFGPAEKATDFFSAIPAESSLPGMVHPMVPVTQQPGVSTTPPAATGRPEDLEARVEQLERELAAVRNARCCNTDVYQPLANQIACLQEQREGVYGSLEVTFLQPVMSGAALRFIIASPDEDLIDSNTESGIRYVFGYRGESGIGIRGRYWSYDDDFAYAPAFAPARLAIETSVADAEMTFAQQLLGWNVETTAGGRYSLLEYSTSAPEGPFGIGTLNFEGVGPTVSVDVRRRIGQKPVSYFGSLRGSWLFGEIGNRTLLLAGPAGSFDGEIMQIYENQLGIAIDGSIRKVAMELRIAWESQFWLNNSLADDSFGIGTNLAFTGPSIAAELRY